MRKIFLIMTALLLAACSGKPSLAPSLHTEYSEFFDIIDSTHIVSISPYGNQRDTLTVSSPMDNIVCMSTSHIAFLDAIGKDSVISAVSGLDYVSSKALRSRDDVYDIGYESQVDYERIVSLNPDVLIAYSVSAIEPQYVAKLKSLGIPVLTVNEHLESHPLARAEYVRLFGALTGTMNKADSVFAAVKANYLSLCDRADTSGRVKVLMNLPYNDQWFIPGGDNYMARLVHDAGGETLGSVPGNRNSGVISVEKAYLLAKDANVWLNPGNCTTREQIDAINPLFAGFDIPYIYNNTLRVTPEGGNDFWESAVVRPDLVLEDLMSIFSGAPSDSLNYYLKVN